MKPILIQKRGPCGNPDDYFVKTWSEYKKGFSKNCEGWMGLDKLHNLTKENNYVLKISFTTYHPESEFKEKDYEVFYNIFRVGSEKDNYRLEVGGYDKKWSTASNRFAPKLNDIGLQVLEFSTWDKDNGALENSCSEKSGNKMIPGEYGGGGGWWLDPEMNGDCSYSNLNGLNLVYHNDTLDEDKFDSRRMRWGYVEEGHFANSSKMELFPKGKIFRKYEIRICPYYL